MNETGLTVLRWIARIGALASVGTLLLFAMPEGPDSPGIRAEEIPMFLAFPVGVVLGMLLGWWRPWVGGLLTVTSLFAFYAIETAQSGSLPTGPWFVIFALPGLLFLFVGWLEHGRAARPSMVG